MRLIKTASLTAMVIVFVLASIIQADVSIEKARKIGEKNLHKLIDQSYHYRVEFDTVIVLPVHSKTIWKNDFYLLYFLKDDYFQVEMEIDQKTGDPTIMAMGTMSPPYQELHTGTFNHRYFCTDSVLNIASMRQRMDLDSARLAYFGVIPKLGKRGVIWEVFSAEGSIFISFGGPNLSLEQLVRGINTVQRKGGNYVADSIRMAEIMTEIKRLQTLSTMEKKRLKLKPKALESLMTALKEERTQMLVRFPGLGRTFPLDE